jgi:tetratricopeptide (TPR) repeat protein
MCVRCGIVLVACSVLTGCSAIRRQCAERSKACDSLCQQARVAKNEGWPDQADLLLNEALRQRPADIETRRNLAEAMWDCGRQQEAIAEYSELAQRHPGDARLHQRLAVMYWTTGQPDPAAQSAERALRLNPAGPEALLVKARSEAARHEYDAAVATYIRLSRVAPEMIDAKLELAEIHVQLGHSHQACVLLRDVITRPQLTAAQKADAEWKLGLAYAAADRWSDAATHLENSIGKRNATAADWQVLHVAKNAAGQETVAIPSKAVMASARERTDANSTCWESLRDRLIARDGLVAQPAGVANNNVTRADFSKSAARDQ